MKINVLLKKRIKWTRQMRMLMLLFSCIYKIRFIACLSCAKQCYREHNHDFMVLFLLRSTYFNVCHSKKDGKFNHMTCFDCSNISKVNQSTSYIFSECLFTMSDLMLATLKEEVFKISKLSNTILNLHYVFYPTFEHE